MPKKTSEQCLIAIFLRSFEIPYHLHIFERPFSPSRALPGIRAALSSIEGEPPLEVVEVLQLERTGKYIVMENLRDLGYRQAISQICFKGFFEILNFHRLIHDIDDKYRWSLTKEQVRTKKTYKILFFYIIVRLKPPLIYPS